MVHKHRKICEDEPTPDDEELVEKGGESIVAAGFTSGGAPYGVTIDENREMSMKWEPKAGWARARRVLDEVFSARAMSADMIDIGWVKYLGEGLYRKAFIADVDVVPDPDNLTDRYVVLLPKPNTDASFEARVQRETTILTRLSKMHLPFKIPKLVGIVQENDRPVLVETFIPGTPLDLRIGRQCHIKPWEVIGQLSAAIHAIDPDVLRGIDIDWHITRRDYAVSSLSVFEGIEDPIVRDAHAWALANLPPPTPSVILHGDMLGQNILLSYSSEELDKPSLSIIDWEYVTVGDPAYDFAIVTRGVRRPFQHPNGLSKLLQAYAEASGNNILASEVHFHELCMATQWYRDSLANAPHRKEHHLALLRRILKRAI